MKSLTEIIGIDKKGVERNVFNELDALNGEHLYENVYSFVDYGKTPRWCTFTLVETTNYNGANASTLYQHLNSFTGLRKECNGLSRQGFASFVIEINPNGANSGWYLLGFRGGGAAPRELSYRKKQVNTGLIGGSTGATSNLIPEGLACVGRQIK